MSEVKKVDYVIADKIVTTCKECSCVSDYYHECQNSATDKYEIPDYPNIPPWCPLPDYEESTDRLLNDCELKEVLRISQKDPLLAAQNAAKEQRKVTMNYLIDAPQWQDKPDYIDETIDAEPRCIGHSRNTLRLGWELACKWLTDNKAAMPPEE